MISAELIRGVQELFEGREVEQRPGEVFGDFLAPGLRYPPGRQRSAIVPILLFARGRDHDLARRVELRRYGFGGVLLWAFIVSFTATLVRLELTVRTLSLSTAALVH